MIQFSGAGTVTNGEPSDDFNRADSATSLGTSSSGHLWVAQQGVWGISSNKAYIDSASTHSIAYIEASESDVSIEVKLSKTDATNNLNRMGIAFRVTDQDNYLYAYFNLAGSLRLSKQVANVDTIITSTSVTTANGDVLKVTCAGDQINVYQNDVLRIGPITETHNQTATKHGLFREVGGDAITVLRFDDFAVTF